MNLTVPWKASNETPVNGIAHKLDEVRKALSQEAEHLAQVAAQFGREAGAQASSAADDAAHQASKLAADAGHQASTVARDPVGTASGLAQSLMKGAAELGTALAISGRKTVDDAAENAQSLAQDLRKVRITTEPKKSGPNFAAGITLLAGFGGGLALMYFTDPDQGPRRRALLRDQITKWTRITRETASGTAKDLSNRAQGAMIETRKAVQNVMPTGASTEADTETQTWETSAASGYGTAYGSTPASDPSTTDTWGEQPQPQSSERIEIS